jgi:hypothetical protein
MPPRAVSHQSYETRPAGALIVTVTDLQRPAPREVSDEAHPVVLLARYPLNPRHPIRRALGDSGETTLEQARDKARLAGADAEGP